MATQSSNESPLQRLGGTIRFLVLVVGAGTLVMVLSYHAVLWYARGHAGPFGSAPTATSEADELQTYSEELKALMRSYLERSAQEPTPPGEPFIRWSKESFVPRVTELGRRIQASTASSEAMSALLSASDRVSAMARQPGDLHLRQRATEDVFDAVATVENRIAVLEDGNGYTRKP